MGHVICYLLIALLHRAFADGKDDTQPTAQSVSFLERYGYLEPVDAHSGQLRMKTSFSDAVKKFQKFAGLPVTGKLDPDTLRKMGQPRCGMQDSHLPQQRGHALSSRLKRFALQGSYWKRKKLTYRIMNYSYRLSPVAVRATIRNVLDKWQEVSNVQFKESLTSNADILIRFVRGYHNDQYSFDGKGGTLAHAFYPHDNTGLAGDAHFDDDEEFTLGTSRGTNFYWVALHELGHSIGLEHSSVQGAIMFPWYQGYKGDDAKLTYDDIVGIQSIYGRPDKIKYTKEQNPDHSGSSKSSNRSPPVCLSRLKAVYLGKDGRTYVINNGKVHILGRYLNYAEGPFDVYKYFPGLDRIDTAYKQKDGTIVLFHGKRFWIYDGQKRIQGPDNIAVLGLTRDMQNLDASFYWSKNNKVYFFKRRWYWRYDPRRKRVDPGYPKLIASWHGIPNGLDGVFQWLNDKIYFFKGAKFYRFNERTGRVQHGYPRNIVGDFVICPSKIGQHVLRSSSATFPGLSLLRAICLTIHVILLLS